VNTRNAAEPRRGHRPLNRAMQFPLDTELHVVRDWLEVGRFTKGKVNTGYNFLLFSRSKSYKKEFNIISEFESRILCLNATRTIAKKSLRILTGA